MYPAVRGKSAVALLGVLILLLSGTPAAAAVTPGLVLTSTGASLPAELSSLATARRITYVTTAVDGSTVSATGLVLTPKSGKANRTVVWGHGATGLADKCAPSTNPAVFRPEARAAVAALLARGWTVTAPDYPGLGTLAAHPYLIGAAAARSMIDSVRAARRLDGALTARYAVDGHSQGGQGALFTAELAPGYDGALDLRGVAAIAPVSNADLVAPLIPGTPGQGHLVMGLFGLQAVDPAVDATALLATPARLRLPVLQTGCLYEILAAYAALTPQQLLTGGALPDTVVAKLARHVNPGQAAPSSPIMLVHGTADESVPYDITAGALVSELDAYDQPMLFIPVEGAGHDSAVTETTRLVADWLATRLP
jgi:predicted esterase